MDKRKADELVYLLEGYVEDLKERARYGNPSAEYYTGELDGIALALELIKINMD